MTQPRKQLLRRMLVRFVIIYCACCFLVFCFQRSLLYFPTHKAGATQLSPWDHDGETIGYCREVVSPGAIWLMMHGNAGQASDRDYVLDRMSPRDALYVLEYPGYGGRKGTPSQTTINKAALHAYDCLRSRYPDIPVCVIGESIGSGPASMLASARPAPEKIVLITPFDTLYGVAVRRFFILPVWLLLLDRWDNIAALQGYGGEVDIYGAEADTVIPVHHAEELRNACPRASYQSIPGGHNDWPQCAKVLITHQQGPEGSQ